MPNKRGVIINGPVAKISGLYRPKTKIWLTEGKLNFRKLINVPPPRLLGIEEYMLKMCMNACMCVDVCAFNGLFSYNKSICKSGQKK